LAMESYQKTLLDNGIRCLTEAIPTLESTAIGIWIQTGSRDEQVAECGLSHFIEHLLFKGTERRSAFDISREIESVGGAINAFTGKEYTCFHAKVLKRDTALAVDILADMVAHRLPHHRKEGARPFLPARGYRWLFAAAVHPRADDRDSCRGSGSPGAGRPGP
jgi:predicted Zn-dependent peptidase